jgi:L-seryl-tRNA(Ser) seleniumtransferase
MSSHKQDLLRKIPPVETFLQDPELMRLADQIPYAVRRDAVRVAVARLRKQFLDEMPEEIDQEAVHHRVVAEAVKQVGSAMEPQYRKVINASGVILHTGLGRAVLPAAAMQHLVDDLSGYSLLQMDIETGRRGARDARIEGLLRQLTGAEAATVVNNNAAATSIVLSTIAAGKEVIVSRGQLVEIGGSFRLPEVMEISGAKLVEVGTTNKTHARDYERAVTENTAAIMRVHPSNYKISGFTSEVPLRTLVEIAHGHRLVLYDDLGAGPLVDVSQFGFKREPTLIDSVRAGADLVSCSADKLIGGPQGGIILGRAKWVRAVRKNPFARIVRAGKLTLAALEATLPLFLDQARAFREVPTLRLLARPLDEIAQQAERIAVALTGRSVAADVAVVKGYSQMGSGSLPTQNLPTRLVAIVPGSESAGLFARRLRQHRPPIFTRVKKQRVLIDPRTVLDGEEQDLIDGVAAVLGTGE